MVGYCASRTSSRVELLTVQLKAYQFPHDDHCDLALAGRLWCGIPRSTVIMDLRLNEMLVGPTLSLLRV